MDENHQAKQQKGKDAMEDLEEEDLEQQHQTWWQKSRVHSWWEKIRSGLGLLWQQIKQRRIATVVVGIVLVVVLALIIVVVLSNGIGLNGYDKVTREFNPSEQLVKTTREYQPGKTVWDLLQLLIVPIIVTIGGFWLNQIQKSREERATKQRDETERFIALDNQQEAALEAYIDKMSELLLKEHLRESVSEKKVKINDNKSLLKRILESRNGTSQTDFESRAKDEVQKIARVRTLTVLPQLDKKRKRNLLLFLYESDLIGNNKPIVILKGASLENAYLENIHLKEANLEEANLEEANLKGANLEGANLRNANLRGASLEKFVPHIAYAWPCYTQLNECHLEGANLERAHLSEARLERACLQGASLYGADLLGARLRGANLEGAKLDYTNLQGVTFEDAVLRSVTLSDVKMPAANLTRANLTKTPLLRVDLSGGDLNEANLEEAQMYEVDLKRAFLFRADLRRASLQKVNLTGANLMGANLEAASLREVDLSSADLRGANLSNTNLTNVKLLGASYNKKPIRFFRGEYYDIPSTRWPTEFDPDKAGAKEDL